MYGDVGYADDMWKYTISTSSWSNIKPISALNSQVSEKGPGGRAKSGVWVSSDNTVYIYGGESAQTSG